ncbi:MAG: helix-turn-helix domain-containing protein, partial [Gammaproteobacteria bacterium]
FDVVARPGYGISTFSIPKPVVEQYLEINMDAPIDGLLHFEDGIIPISPEIAIYLRTMVNKLSSCAHHLSNSSGQFDPVQSLDSQLLENLLRSLQLHEQVKRELGAKARSRMLKRAREYIKGHGHERINVRDLAAATNTSERTLERIFNRVFGMSPKKYLLGERLYGAHRELWQSNPSVASVAKIANAWGFWHMGQFAKTYRLTFGELPSETLNRSRTT